MSLRRSAAHRAACLGALAVCALGVGCGGSKRPVDYTWVDGTRARRAGEALHVRWTERLATPFEGRSIPVERAGVAADPAGHRVYVASTTGALWALGSEGGKRYRYDVGASVEAPPVVDPRADALFVTAATGEVHALRASTGELRWKASVGGPVSAAMQLSDDALYVAGSDDSVVAFSREDGDVLWRVRRDPRPGFKIAGQAGLLLQDGRVITGFSDGTIAALDAGDGRELWHVNTGLDVRGSEQDRTRFLDVDTTPVQVGENVYAASFSGGLYVLDAERGIVREHKSELTGITGIATDGRSMVLSSADLGVLALDLASHAVRWHHPIDRGAPGQASVHHGVIYVAESGGALLALALADGREIGRVESGHGFDAGPSLHAGRGFILSNAGTLFAFTYR